MAWEQLKRIIDQSRQDAAEARDKPPEVCPIDGDRLVVRADGSRNCPMGNYRWSG